MSQQYQGVIEEVDMILKEVPENHEMSDSLCPALIRPILESNFQLRILNTILGYCKWAREKEWR